MNKQRTSQAHAFQTDLRIRQTVVKQALELYRTLARWKKGYVIFLAGWPGSGRTATLQALAKALPREHPRPLLIAGRFEKGQYYPWKTEREVKVPLKEVVAAIGETIPLAASVSSPLVGSIIAFVGQLLQASAAAWELVDSFRQLRQSLPDSPEALKILLRRATQARPVVCLLDDLDEAEGSWWSDFILTFALEVNKELRLLLFLSYGRTDGARATSA